MKKILFYYCTVLAIFISASGIISSKNTSQLLMQLIFLPVAVYFTYSLIVQIISKEKTKTDESNIKKPAVIFSIIFLMFFLAVGLINITKNPVKKDKPEEKVVLTQSPKPTSVSYITLKKDYLKDKINVRDSASTSGKIIGKLENIPYQLVSKNKSWYEIIFNKTRGFVSDKFVEIKQ